MCLSLNFLAALWLRTPIMAPHIINAITEGNILYLQHLPLNRERSTPYLPSIRKIRKFSQKLANFVGMEIPPPNVLTHAKLFVQHFGLNDQAGDLLLHYVHCVHAKLAQQPFKVLLHPFNEGAMGHEEYILSIIIISIKMTFGGSNLEDLVHFISQPRKTMAFYSLSLKDMHELASNQEKLSQYIKFYERMYPHISPKLEELHDTMKIIGSDFTPMISEEGTANDDAPKCPEPSGLAQYPLFQNVKAQAPHFEKLLSICSEYGMIDPIPLLGFVRKIEGYLNKLQSN
mmetsp:Transcript_17128/g.23818  ORF Transcript_17128/g.23818 Transcript_17128/m.23818 type:complete len:287 (-) Transcript_17128:658-1518(-)